MAAFVLCLCGLYTVFDRRPSKLVTDARLCVGALTFSKGDAAAGLLPPSPLVRNIFSVERYQSGVRFQHQMLSYIEC